MSKKRLLRTFTMTLEEKPGINGQVFYEIVAKSTDYGQVFRMVSYDAGDAYWVYDDISYRINMLKFLREAKGMKFI